MLKKYCLLLNQMDTATWVLILDEAVCISHNVNTLRKRLHTTYLLKTMGKFVGQTEIIKLDMTTNLREWKFPMQSC